MRRAKQVLGTLTSWGLLTLIIMNIVGLTAPGTRYASVNDYMARHPPPCDSYNGRLFYDICTGRQH